MNSWNSMQRLSSPQPSFPLRTSALFASTTPLILYSSCYKSGTIIEFLLIVQYIPPLDVLILRHIDITELSYILGQIHTLTENFRSISPAFSESFDFSRQVKIWGTRKKLISVHKKFENFISMEEHIVVFEQYILDNCDRLVKFEVIDERSEVDEWYGFFGPTSQSRRS